jgi:hypothetical protein
MILAKVHVVNGKKLVAVCDAVLLGKKFEEKGLQLDLTGSFYKGEEMDEKKLEAVLKGAYVVNMVGEESVGFGIKKGLIKKEKIITIANVKHAQAMAAE